MYISNDSASVTVSAETRREHAIIPSRPPAKVTASVTVSPSPAAATTARSRRLVPPSDR